MKLFLFFIVLATCIVGGYMQAFISGSASKKSLFLSSRNMVVNRLHPGPPTTPDVPPLPLSESVCVPQPKCAPVFMDKYATMDGSCNNRVQKNWGRTDQTLRRFLPPDYGDGKGLPRRGLRNRVLESARKISSVMSGLKSEESTTNSLLTPFWGQFIIHDIALTPVIEKSSNGHELECECEQSAKDCVNIPIPMSDRQYKAEKKACFPLKRSLPVAKHGVFGCDKSVRQQVNTLTSFIDLGVIYGSSQEYLSSLLEDMGEGGELKQQQRGYDGKESRLLPLQEEFKNTTFADRTECPITHRPEQYSCYVSGDIRTNENSALISQHTFWMRQHNMLVKKLRKINPKWDNVRLFQTTRSILSALAQRITYEHFLPIILGETVMKRFDLTVLKKGYYYGYDSSFDATVSNAFNTAAFRMGHSLLSPKLFRPDPSWKKKQADDIALKDSLFNAEPILNKKAGGPDSILRGLLQNNAQQFDTTVVDDLTNFLFAENGLLGLDLLAINIERGRDHGIPAYVHFRKFCGLHVPRDFDDLRGVSKENKNKLKSLYRRVDEIDLFIGGLSEASVKGGTAGPTFACLIGYQFRDLKKGDRFWHENGGDFKSFTIDQLDAIQSATYSKILCDGIENLKTIQPYPMLKVSASNKLKSCDKYKGLDVAPWGDNYVSTTFHKIEPDYEWTAWFPSSLYSGLMTSPAETLNYLLQHQPDRVCRQVVDTETREVNKKLQVRYKCLPGTIRHSDFPSYISEDFIWTEWIDNGQPNIINKHSDYEVRSDVDSFCANPFAIQVQTLKEVPAGETGEVFRRFSPITGFICIGKDQESGKCSNYQVRYLCRRGEGNSGKKTDDDDGDDSTYWTEWISTDSNRGRGDVELLRVINQEIKVCKTPQRIEARTKVGHVSFLKAGDRIRKMSPIFGFICYHRDQRRRRKCRDYEVRFFCRENKPTTKRTMATVPAGIPSVLQIQATQWCQRFSICCDGKKKN